jgi:large subunit ribosomal protein L37Ae
MENRTRKVGITGKYATRYGQKLRKQVKAIEILQRTKSICPFCGKKSIKREAAGIWKCRGCRRAIAGGAWEFVTTAATTAKTTINRLKKNIESRKKPEKEREEDEDEEETKQKGKKEKKEKKEKPEKQNKDKEKKDKKDKKGKAEKSKKGK